MSESHFNTSDSDDAIADAIEEITRRLASGEHVRIEEVSREYPDIANELHELFPIMTAVAEHAGSSPEISHSTLSTISGHLESGVLGDFRILHELGRGGMGIVYEAEQISLGRRVAVKVLPLASLLDKRQLERFRNEARAAAMLKHPNIVNVYQVSCERGVHYYAMELVEGQSLSNAIRGLRGEQQEFEEPTIGASGDTVPIAALSTQRSSNKKAFFRSIAQLAIQAADALHFAHQEGVIHRDIKPSNLLLDNQGKLWIADFGLAQIHGDNDLTLTGDLVGTLRYMSPEQASGEPLDRRTDVYSLGLVLFEMLALNPTFTALNRQELLQQILEKEAPSLRRVNPQIPKDLETIVRRAIDKRPELRYQTCAELSADLARFLDGQPILARRSSVWNNSLRWAQRNPLISSMTLAIGLLVVVLAIGATVTAVKQTASARNIRSLLDDVQVRNYAISVAAAYDAFDDGDVSRAKQLLSPHIESTGSNSDVPFELGHLWNRCRYVAEGSSIPSLAAEGPHTLSPDGKYLITTTRDGVIRIWDIRSLSLVQSINVEERISSIATSPSNMQLAVGTHDGKLFLIHGNSFGECTTLFQHQRSIQTITFSPDESMLAYCDAATVVWLYDLDQGEVQREPQAIDDFFGNTTASVAFSPDGRTLVCSGGWARGVARVWSIPDTKLVTTLNVSSQIHDIVPIVFSEDGSLLVTAGKQIVVWRTADWTILKRFQVDNRALNSVTISSDRRLIAASDRGRIRLFDLQARRELEAIDAHRSSISNVVFSTARKCLVSMADDGQARIWDEDRWADRYLNYVPPTTKVSVCFAGRQCTSPICVSSVHGFDSSESHRGQLALFDGAEGVWTVNDQWRFAASAVASCPSSPHIVAVGSQLGNRTWGITLWDTKSRNALTQLTGHEDLVYSLAFSPDGKLLASADLSSPFRPGRDFRRKSKLIVWDVVARSIVHEISSIRITGLSFSGDGQRLAVVGASEKKVRFLNIESGQWESTGLSCDGSLLSVQFSPDGKLLACGDYKGGLYIWEVAEQRRLFTERVGATLCCLAFSPDGRTLATGSTDSTVHLWHVDTGSKLATLKPKGSPITITFSGDGAALVAGCADASVAMWHVDGWKRIDSIPLPTSNGDSLTESMNRPAVGAIRRQAPD